MKLDIQMFSSPYVAFEDLPSTDTPIDSTNLNKIQTDCRDEIGDLTLLETTDKSDLVSAINENKRNIDEGGGGGGIVALKSITTEPSTFDTGDKYYDAEDDLIYTATSSSTWDEGEEPKVTSLYLNEADNNLYRYYNNTMHLESGGDTLPINAIVEYDGSTVPTGYELVEDYSTSEVKTSSTWIDGKPIYRKVFVVENITNGSDSDISLTYDKIISLNGIVEWNNTQTKHCINWISAYTTSSTERCDVVTINNGIRFRNRTSVTVKLNLIVEYTKTTD